jgi:hypothetical protein
MKVELESTVMHDQVTPSCRRSNRLRSYAMGANLSPIAIAPSPTESIFAGERFQTDGVDGQSFALKTTFKANPFS